MTCSSAGGAAAAIAGVAASPAGSAWPLASASFAILQFREHAVGIRDNRRPQKNIRGSAHQKAETFCMLSSASSVTCAKSQKGSGESDMQKESHGLRRTRGFSVRASSPHLRQPLLQLR